MPGKPPKKQKLKWTRRKYWKLTMVYPTKALARAAQDKVGGIIMPIVANIGESPSAQRASRRRKGATR